MQVLKFGWDVEWHHILKINLERGTNMKKKCQLDEKGSYNWKSTPIAENGTVKKQKI